MIIEDNQKIKYCIIKKIELPLSKNEIISQHKFINYLKQNNFSTAKIYNLYRENNQYFEIQELINISNNNIDILKLIELLAQFHKLSKEYTDNLFKHNKYDMIFTCKDVVLDKVLLGFKQKYYFYPLNNYQTKKGLIVDNKMIEETNSILVLYKKIYQFFIKNYNINSCIIHNDITSNNVINSKNKLYLIDFDLSIVGSEYVDFIDAIIRRNKTIEEIYGNYSRFKMKCKKYIDRYNSINNYQQLDMNGCLAMLILKLVSVHLYLLLNEVNLNSYKNNNHYIYLLINNVFNDLKGGI